MVVDECPKIFDLPCIWIFERTFVSLENIFVFNSLSANPTKWPNTLKQFVGELFECLATLLILCLKGYVFADYILFSFYVNIYGKSVTRTYLGTFF